jgi:hypothetical protein
MQIVLWKNATSLYRTQHYCTELTQFFLLKNKTGQSFGKSIDKDLDLICKWPKFSSHTNHLLKQPASTEHNRTPGVSVLSLPIPQCLSIPFPSLPFRHSSCVHRNMILDPPTPATGFRWNPRETDHRRVAQPAKEEQIMPSPIETPLQLASGIWIDSLANTIFLIY